MGRADLPRTSSSRWSAMLTANVSSTVRSSSVVCTPVAASGSKRLSARPSAHPGPGRPTRSAACDCPSGRARGERARAARRRARTSKSRPSGIEAVKRSWANSSPSHRACPPCSAAAEGVVAPRPPRRSVEVGAEADAGQWCGQVACVADGQPNHPGDSSPLGPRGASSRNSRRAAAERPLAAHTIWRQSAAVLGGK